MGLFGGNFSKEGPGVSKNAPEKNRFFLFFELLGRKFSKLIPLNLMYFITLLPLIFGVILSVTFNPQILSGGNIYAENLGKLPIFIFTGDIIGLALIIVSIFVTGPATCGFTYVLRNMQRQEHTWILSDFREQFAKNYKQGVIMSIIDIVAVFLLYVAYCFYAYSMPVIMSESAVLAALGQYFILVIAVLFIIMHYYIYTMIVTFDMKIKNILKNAAIFSLAKLPLNIFITIILVAAILASVWYFVVGVICALVISLSLLGFIVVFSVYPTIESSMISSQLPQNSDDEEEKDFEDTI
ncbi:MAG: YesL family protein [Clostridia bacterium]|nr:YesL family protein [Clostridia bacterium]